MKTLLCPTVAWDTITNTEHHQARTHTLPFTPVLLYMQPEHNYKIKHRGHFKIKARYLLERGIFPLYYIHLIVCCFREAAWSFRHRSRTKTEFPKPDGGAEEGGGRRKTEFCAGEEEKSIRSPMEDGWQQLIRIFLCGISSSPLLHCIHPDKLVPICPSTLHTAAPSHDKKTFNKSRSGSHSGGEDAGHFSGRSRTFCGKSIGQSIGKKILKQSHGKHPDKKLRSSGIFLRFCPSRSKPSSCTINTVIV